MNFIQLLDKAEECSSVSLGSVLQFIGKACILSIPEAVLDPEDDEDWQLVGNFLR